MRTGVVIQARMDSTRLPGKCLMKLGGKPMLAYLFERMARCGQPDIVALATTARDVDAPLIGLAEEYGVAVFAGDLENVAGRMLGCAERFGLDGFVRVCGDSPFLDCALVDRAVELFAAEEANWDLVTNIRHRTYPKGQSVEVFRTTAFARAVGLASRPDHREHAGSLIYEESEQFAIHDFTSGHDWGGIQLSVDEAEDFRLAGDLLALMDRDHWHYSCEEIVSLRRSLETR